MMHLLSRSRVDWVFASIEWQRHIKKNSCLDCKKVKISLRRSSSINAFSHVCVYHIDTTVSIQGPVGVIDLSILCRRQRRRQKSYDIAQFQFRRGGVALIDPWDSIAPRCKKSMLILRSICRSTPISPQVSRASKTR